jgi:hypothetical protein
VLEQPCIGSEAVGEVGCSGEKHVPANEDVLAHVQLLSFK